MALPRLTQARAPLTHDIVVTDEHGERRPLAIPAERPLTVYVDKRELVTLMTLGAQPELLVLGYLRNQRLVRSPEEIESITVDWDVGAAAVVTRGGIDRIEARTARKVVTTGCGQGSVFGGLMDEVETLELPAGASITQSQLYAIVNTIRLHDSVYKAAGSVHGCALFQGERLLHFVEDVGRHNAIDTIAGWMSMRTPTLPMACGSLPSEGAGPSWERAGGGPATLPARPVGGADKVFYTTGRLTSEMIIKAAQMGVPVVVSRSGITQMGHAVAERLGLCAIGRAVNRRFLCFTAPERLRLEPGLATAPVVLPQRTGT